MTGKDLIIYILKNDLENVDLFKDGKPLGFITEEEAAVKMNVGVATVRAWASIGIVYGIKINDTNYILDGDYLCHHMKKE